MSMALMAQAMSIKVGNPLRKLVLLKLADNANDQCECWPSYQYLADQCECSKSSIKEHIAELISMGLLRKENRLGEKNGKGNTSNLYYLTLGKNNRQLNDNTPVPPKNTGESLKSTPVPPNDPPPVPSDDTRTSHSFESVKEPIKRAQEMSEKKPSTKLPKDFKPNVNHQALAREKGIDLVEEFEKFTDHHLAKGSRFIEWDRALNNWIRQAATFAGRKAKPAERVSSKPSNWESLTRQQQQDWYTYQAFGC